MLEVNDKLPEFNMLNEKGEMVKSGDLLGKKFILFFYPKDNTPGCKNEVCSLNDNYNKLKEMGYSIYGVSSGTIKSHEKFAGTNNLGYSLLLDEDYMYSTKACVYVQKKLCGREYMGIKRTTFVVDENQVITHIIDKVNVKTHGEDLLKLL